MNETPDVIQHDSDFGRELKALMTRYGYHSLIYAAMAGDNTEKSHYDFHLAACGCLACATAIIDTLRNKPHRLTEVKAQIEAMLEAEDDDDDESQNQKPSSQTIH